MTPSLTRSKGFNEELVDPTKRGWDWLDPSYFIKQRPDTLSGRRYERFKELKQKAPNLDYIYVDVWGNQGESGWASRQLSKEINSLGWFTTNEFPNALEYDSVWNHWSAEKITAVQQRKALTVQSFVLFGIIKRHLDYFRQPFVRWS